MIYVFLVRGKTHVLDRVCQPSFERIIQTTFYNKFYTYGSGFAAVTVKFDHISRSQPQDRGSKYEMEDHILRKFHVF